MPLLVDAEIKKRSNEGKSETEIQLQEMKEQLEKMKAEKLKADMSAKYTKVLSEKGLSTELIDFVLGADDETTTANIDKINSIIGNVANNRVKEKIGESSYKQEGTKNTNVGKITWEQVVERREHRRLHDYPRHRLHQEKQRSSFLPLFCHQRCPRASFPTPAFPWNSCRRACS